MSKPGAAEPDPKLSSHHCEQSFLQASEERLGPPLGSLTGQNIPSEHRASMQVSTEQREPGSQGSQTLQGSWPRSPLLSTRFGVL